ncbi:MAG: hypothetical protein R3Y28_08630 [Candidatus Gastranaerophilales bacterium]
MRINPITTNKATQITFGDNNINDTIPSNAILSLQNPNAKINFEHDFEQTQKADMVQSNFFSALAHKAVRAYKTLTAPVETRFDTAENHIMYMA